MMIAAAAQRGYDLTAHRGVRLTADLLAWADLVLAMDQAVLEQVRHQAPQIDTSFELLRYLADADVPDPWGKTSIDFAACAALIDTGAYQHLPISQDPAAGDTGR
jgi:protein-tyrosine phosphatase